MKTSDFISDEQWHFNWTIIFSISTNFLTEYFLAKSLHIFGNVKDGKHDVSHSWHLPWI